MDLSGIVSLAIAGLGLGGLVFTALRWRRDDTTAIVGQQDTLFGEMRTLNDELRTTVIALRAENDRLQAQIADLRRELDR